MIVDNSIIHYKNSPKTETTLDDLVIEKLEKYADYLQNEVNKKSGRINGLQPDTDAMVDDTDLERGWN